MSHQPNLEDLNRALRVVRRWPRWLEENRVSAVRWRPYRRHRRSLRVIGGGHG